MDKKTFWMLVAFVTMLADVSAQIPYEFCIYSASRIKAGDTANMVSNGDVKLNFEGQSISYIEIKMLINNKEHQVDTLMHLKLELKDLKLPDSTFIVKDKISQKIFEFDISPGKDKSKKSFVLKDKQQTWLLHAVAKNWFTEVAQKMFDKENEFDPELVRMNLHDTIIDYAAYQDRNNETGVWSKIRQGKLTIDFNVNGLRDVAVIYPDTTIYLKYITGSYIEDIKLKYCVYLDSHCNHISIGRKTNESPAITNFTTEYVFRLFSEKVTREAEERK